VPGGLHDHRLGHTSPSEIPHRRTAKIMEEQPGIPAAWHAKIPAPRKILDRR
jgi:hypothetical protein